MRRIALASVLAAVTTAPVAQAAHDRTDRIPFSVGPADFRAYHVNPTANLPSGVTSERWLSVARRSLERWGGTFAGTTTAAPDTDDDGLNVIGFSNSPQLGGSVVGLNAKSKGGTLRTPGGGETCELAPNMGTTESITSVPSVLRFRLRSDRVRKGKVRRRTLTRTRTLTTPRIDSAPVSGQRCIAVQPGTESDPASVRHESDVLMDASVTNWFAGENGVAPPGDKLDLETVLLHELGHSAGLGHMPQNCDPSTPMRPSGSHGEYWRGLDEVLYSDCASLVVTPDAPHGTESAFPGGSLGGRVFHVNPAVPAGYDSARFVALAGNVVARWGGTVAGTTTAAPTQGDGLSVIGFDVIARPDFEVTTRESRERLVFPAHRTCAVVAGQVLSYRAKRVTKRVRVRVRGRRRTLKVRRDRIVRTSVSGPASGQCIDHAAQSRPGTTTVETDIGIAHEMDAYEMGPGHPVQTTRIDMATLLASALGRAAGVAPADRCARDTPVVVALEPGDWWHGPDDLNRVDCSSGRAAARKAAPEPQSGPVRYVLVQE